MQAKQSVNQRHPLLQQLSASSLHVTFRKEIGGVNKISSTEQSMPSPVLGHRHNHLPVNSN